MSSRRSYVMRSFWLLLTALLFSGITILSVRSQEDNPDDEVCLMCHEQYDRLLAVTEHRLSSSLPDAVIPIQCTSCHSSAVEHVDDPRKDNIGNPAKALAAETEKTCTECHQPHTEAGTAGFDPHLDQRLSCTSCHRIHSTHESLLIDPEGSFCGVCHVSIVNEFRRRSNHPLTDQAVTCMDCHDFTGRNQAGFGQGGNANCYQCHPEQSGPYLYEHEATSSFSTQGDGCTACHQPHGSANGRLLNRPGDQLCLHCHGVPPMHRARHDGLGLQYPCEECHSDVHGSYSSRAFLDPLLGAKIGGEPHSCFCHGVDD